MHHSLGESFFFRSVACKKKSFCNRIWQGIVNFCSKRNISICTEASVFRSPPQCFPFNGQRQVPSSEFSQLSKVFYTYFNLIYTVHKYYFTKKKWPMTFFLGSFFFATDFVFAIFSLVGNIQITIQKHSPTCGKLHERISTIRKNTF